MISAMHRADMIPLAQNTVSQTNSIFFQCYHDDRSYAC